MATAQQHVDKAKALIGSGEDDFVLAAKEIVAARDANPPMSLREIDRQLERGNGYAGRVVRWYESGAPRSTGPFSRGNVRSPNGGDNEWYTRPKYVEAARQVLGGIDLDPASNATAQKVVRATKYYSLTERNEDGLELPWAGRVWLNPPYSRGLIDKFAAKLLHEYGAGRVTAAIMLVDGYSANTVWFKDFWSYPIYAVRGRVFYKPGGEETEAPMVWPYFVYLGRDFDSFVDTFMELDGQLIKDPTDYEWEKRYSSWPPHSRTAA